MSTWHRPVGSLLLLFTACSKPGAHDRAALENMETLARASSAYDSSMNAFLVDLENWSVRAGRPTSAEALIGPLFLRGNALHTPSKGEDSSVVAEYQQLELRFARLLERRDSLNRVAMMARDTLLAWARANAEPVEAESERFGSPVFPPDAGDSTPVAARTGKCSLFYISVLPSKEGVRICILTERSCANDYTFVPPRWMTNCYYGYCFNYIGWVPKEGTNIQIRSF